VVKMMKSALEEDENERDEEKYVGLEEWIKKGKVLEM
jgi:hypothetical protein